MVGNSVCSFDEISWRLSFVLPCLEGLEEDEIYTFRQSLGGEDCGRLLERCSAGGWVALKSVCARARRATECACYGLSGRDCMHVCMHAGCARPSASKPRDSSEAFVESPHDLFLLTAAGRLPLAIALRRQYSTVLLRTIIKDVAITISMHFDFLSR